jgi:hypothetical protein
MGLTAKQEKFARLVALEGKNYTDAFLGAGYSDNENKQIVWKNACEVAKSGKVLVRIQELKDKTLLPELTTAIERRKILSDIERAKYSQFIDSDGKVDVSKLDNPAVQEYKVEETEFGTRETLKLRDPIIAIAEHNKMDRVYDDHKATIGTQYNIMITGEGKDLLNQLKTIDGIVTKSIPKMSEMKQITTVQQDNTDSQAQS